MARSLSKALAPLVALGLLAGCPGRSSSPAPVASAGPLDPMYDPLRVGEVYVVRMDHGTPLTSRVEIKAKTDETVTVVARNEIAGTTHEPEELVIQRRRGPLDEKLAAEAVGQEVLRSETITVSGVRYDCEVVASVEKDQGKVTSWHCAARYPGLVKQVDAAGRTLYELVAIEPPKAP